MAAAPSTPSGSGPQTRVPLQSLPILHLDGHLVAVAKPSGLAVHPGWAPERVTALSRVRDEIGARVFPVHRLDRGTSGVLLFALSPEVARQVQEAFAAGRVEKRYLALVRGIAPEDGVIDHPLRREDSPDAAKVPAVTEFRRLGIWERYSLVEAVPRTGRLHQVRRHLKHLSLPLIGDVRYGKGEHNRLFRERFGLHRLALHALALTLPHPATGEPLALVAPVPEDLAGPLAAMGLAPLFS